MTAQIHPAAPARLAELADVAARTLGEPEEPPDDLRVRARHVFPFPDVL